MPASPSLLAPAALALLLVGFLAGWLVRALYLRDAAATREAELQRRLGSAEERVVRLTTDLEAARSAAEAASARDQGPELRRLCRRLRELESLDRIVRERDERSFQLDFLFRSQLEERDARIAELENLLREAGTGDQACRPFTSGS